MQSVSRCISVYSPNLIIYDCRKEQNYGQVAYLMPLLGIMLLNPREKILSTTFFTGTGTLCCDEDKLSRLFQNDIYRRKKLMNQNINKRT